MSIRIQRINSEMQKAISQIIQNKVNDSRIEGMVSVLGVSVAKDLKTAKVTVSISTNPDGAMEALRSSAGFIRKELSQIFRDLRTTPELTFILDTSLDYSMRINKILDEMNIDKE